MPDLPTYTASKRVKPKGLLMIEAYIVFREHWELIDRVFQIESPQPVQTTDCAALLRMLSWESENPFVEEMFKAVDGVVLGSLSEEQYKDEIQIRKLIAIAFKAKKPQNNEESMKLCDEIRFNYFAGFYDL